MVEKMLLVEKNNSLLKKRTGKSMFVEIMQVNHHSRCF